MKKKQTPIDDFDKQILSKLEEREIEKQALKKILNAFENKNNDKGKRSINQKNNDEQSKQKPGNNSMN